MTNLKIFDHTNKPSIEQKNEILDFLFKHLEKYGDPRSDIEKCLNYSLKENDKDGGFIITAKDNDKIIGAVIVNETGMEKYIPENILVYIATHADYRGKGIGKMLMQETIKITKGDIALHVEPDNPARFLYEKYGFNSKYIEMRYKQK
ncbi:MAG: GNAT family N-acetyltransferase [Bacteroidetes bacterium GWE2_29_8]|nr:MAG: GNAT family N-acetyltransferase [Bacteroidetes bacterium GWE2_29_8]OFY14614.1 MAG: GNAT family N-acetyltransferase [Bacteroidetes bacterium GWF2_29_10]